MSPPRLQPQLSEEQEVGWTADLVAKILAAVSAVSFSVFVLALMAVTDPVTAAVLGHFSKQMCVITESFRNSGATVCENWSSCKNLCADPPVLYNCVHIYVQVYAFENETNTNISKVMIGEREMPMEIGTVMNSVSDNLTETFSAISVSESVWNASSADFLVDANWTQDVSINGSGGGSGGEARSAQLRNLFPPKLEIFGYRVFDEPVTEEPPPPFNVSERPVRFFVNAAGCGYELNCSEFQQRFAEVGVPFPCLYSRILNRTVPIDVPDLHSAWISSIVSPAVPALVSILSLTYLCLKGHCDFPRMTPRHVIIRMIKRKRKKVHKQIRLMQKRGSVRSVRSSAPNTPQSMEWKKRPLPHIQVHDSMEKLEDDLVVQAV